MHVHFFFKLKKPVSYSFWCYLNMLMHIHTHLFGFSIPSTELFGHTTLTWVIDLSCVLMDVLCWNSTAPLMFSSFLACWVPLLDVIFLHSSWFHLKNPCNLPLVLCIFNYVVHLFFEVCSQSKRWQQKYKISKFVEMFAKQIYRTINSIIVQINCCADVHLTSRTHYYVGSYSEVRTN